MAFGISSTHKNTLFRAKSAVLARDFELAIRLFKRLLQEFPDNFELLHELATTYIRSENDEAALSIYQQILKRDRNDFAALIGLGGIYRRLGRFEESVGVLERALALDGNSTQTYYTLGFTYKQMGLFDDALECFDRVIEQNPEDILAYNHLGCIYSLRGDSKNAIASYHRGLQLDANHPILHYNLAHEYEKLGYYDEVIGEYEAALRAKPDWSEAVNGYAVFLMSHNLCKEAYSILCQGIEVAPENIHLQRSMGMVQLRRSEYQDAGQRFEAVLRQEENDSCSLMGLSDVYIHEGRSEESRDLLKKLEPVQEKSKGVKLQYVRSLLNANRFQEAGNLMNDLLNEYSFDLGTAHLLAEYFACCDDQRQLQQTLDKIQEIDSAYFLHFLDVALRFRQIGNLERAQAYLVEYLKHLPHDPVALSALASCYEKCNQYGDAMRFYQQALNWDADNSYLQKALERISLCSQSGCEQEAEQESFVAPKVVSSLRDIYSDAAGRQEVPQEQKEVQPSLHPLIDEEQYKADSGSQFLFQTEKPEKEEWDLEQYDPLELASNEAVGAENSQLSALAQDDGPVDYEPLLAVNSALDFQDEEDEIFDNVNKKPDEIFLRKEPPQPIGEPVAKPRKEPLEEVPMELEIVEEPLPESFFGSEPVPLSMSPDPDEAEPILTDSNPRLSSEAFLPPKDCSLELENEAEFVEPVHESDFTGPDFVAAPLEPELEDEFSETAFVPKSEIGNRMPFQSEVDMPWDFNGSPAEMDNEEDFPLDELEEAEEGYEATLPHGKDISVTKGLGLLLENPSSPEENADIIGLLQELKHLCEYLPQEKKAGFHSSMKLLQMEYIISRLSGKPGLIKIAESIREKGLVEVPAERYDIVERFDESAVSARVMTLMRSLVQQLPDKDNALVLDGSLQQLLNRLSEV